MFCKLLFIAFHKNLLAHFLNVLFIQLLMPHMSPFVGDASLLLKRKSTPRRWWSPLMSGGVPNGSIHMWERGITRRELPAIRLIGELPLWWAAGFWCTGYWWWWRSMRSVSAEILAMWDFVSSTFVSISTSTSLPSWCHWLICAIRSSLNCFLGVWVWKSVLD